MPKWTRERIIRDILAREAASLPVTSANTESGVDTAMYQAALRIFGSWRNAVSAAGLPASQARLNREWTPGRIRKVIRSLARTRRSLSAKEFKHRYASFLQAARRHFGSWSKAVMASGIDPQVLRRVPAWSKDRVIEGILTRALRSESLNRGAVQPRALVDAATRLFGSWKAALSAAGVETIPTTKRALPDPSRDAKAIGIVAEMHEPGTHWTDRAIIDAIQVRRQHNLALDATSMCTECAAVYYAGTRRFGNWGRTLAAAGLDPLSFRRLSSSHREPQQPLRSSRLEHYD